jgi:hypothetical protein
VLEPENLKTLTQRARVRLKKGVCDGAVEDYRAILKAKPDHKQALKDAPKAQQCASYTLALHSHFDAGRFPAALSAAKQVSNNQSSDDIAWVYSFLSCCFGVVFGSPYYHSLFDAERFPAALSAAKQVSLITLASVNIPFITFISNTHVNHLILSFLPFFPFFP